MTLDCLGIVCEIFSTGVGGVIDEANGWCYVWELDYVYIIVKIPYTPAGKIFRPLQYTLL